ncbi:TIM barrel protein [Mameliella alba]|nr:TIM barrel protein [Antarctobacter heliothermus]MBY6146374.1 TIM barrel protein [Mameliella alba]MCA0955773.1 TIM barrel protein [Mameliella alba]
MPKFSANLGFLWADMPLAQAIRAAARAGFDAVECHWPAAEPQGDVRAALNETGLSLLGLNTARGPAGDLGLSALPGRAAEARAAVAEAIALAEAFDAQAIHVMAGNSEGPAAHEAFLETLSYACAQTDRMILIEPLNAHDAPDYFLRDTAQAERILAELDTANGRLMFDCYHVGRTEGDVAGRFRALLPRIGHVQFAAVPDRGAPDHGEVDYPPLFALFDQLGWDRPIGAEYRPAGATEDSLGWLADARRG